MFNLYNALLLASLLLLIGMELWRPARQWKPVKGWYARATTSAVAYFLIASYAPFMWDQWLGNARLFDATHWPLAAAVTAGYLVYQLALYFWHRALHKSDFLWRHLHQMHHSAERMEAIGALYFHPVDLLAFVFVGSLALTLGIGLSPLATAIVGIVAGILSILTHANIRTPHWLGLVIARPEMHGLHHTRGRHAGNYGEIALWDMLFGTYENPRTWNSEVGFYHGASARVRDMLLGVDVTSPLSIAAPDQEQSSVTKTATSASTTKSKVHHSLFQATDQALVLVLGTSIIFGMAAAFNQVIY